MDHIVYDKFRKKKRKKGEERNAHDEKHEDLTQGEKKGRMTL